MEARVFAMRARCGALLIACAEGLPGRGAASRRELFPNDRPIPHLFHHTNPAGLQIPEARLQRGNSRQSGSLGTQYARSQA